MDANGLQFWMLSQANDWRITESSGLYFSSLSNRLRLDSPFGGGSLGESLSSAATLVEIAPMARDEFNTYARWDPLSAHVVAGGGGPGEVPIYAAPTSQAVTDLVMGYDDVLYLAVGGVLVLIDRRGRWPNTTLAPGDFNFWRLAACPDGGVLALDRIGRQLGRVIGQPLQTGPVDVPDPGIMRSCAQNPNPPHVSARYALPAAATETLVALCAMASGEFALLSWTGTTTPAIVRTFTEATGFGTGVPLAGTLAPNTVALAPYTMAWIGDTQIAVLVTNSDEALVFDLANANGGPLRDSYILTGQNLGPFVHGFDLPAGYPNPAWFGNPPPAWQPATAYSVGQSILDPNANIQSVQTAGTSGYAQFAWNATPGQTTPDGSVAWYNAGPLSPLLPLLPLSLNTFVATGATDPTNPPYFDSGSSQTVWHRLFLEAIVPQKCGVLVWLAAADTLSDLQSSATIWYPHIVGSADTSNIAPAVLPEVPIAVWQSESCEVPFAAPLLDEEPVANQSGLFMVLVQRAGKLVRSLAGRYLGVQIQLNGDSRNTPEIAALRAYASRFSYVEHYLPEIYQEDKFPPEADQSGSSTRRDFFERFVDLFEAQFTRIEDRIANAYLLTRPESTPDSALDWLGGWVGIEPNGYPPDRRRARLQAISGLYRQRGTAPGIAEALDVATDGMCTSGAVIVIEDFRLRHIFATILGADLSIKNDPLLPGYSPSSNSIVGDTLFLGDPRIQAELQALYETNLNLPGGEQGAQQLYDSMANRITIFVHDQVEPVDFSLIVNVVNEEKPAHVMASTVRASQPFMIGLASLLGVNTYLGPEPSLADATVGVSQIGRYDIVTHMPSLDPRLAGWQGYTAWPKPVARLNAPASVAQGATLHLDGSASTAPPGESLVTYEWKLLST